MVKNRPLRVKKAKHACKICGSYKAGEVLSVSREREHRNSFLICKKCVDELKVISDENFSEKFVCMKCKKEFETKKGLQIHISKCDALKEKN